MATNRLVQSLAGEKSKPARDPIDFLMGGGGADDASGSGLGGMTGAKGTAALEMMRRDFESNPRKTTQVVRFGMARANGTDPKVGQDALAFFSRYGCYRGKHEWAYVSWMIGAIWNALELQQHETAHALTGVALAALDQAMLSGGNFQCGYLWTHLPEPPWGVIDRVAVPGEIRPYSRLASPVWIASTVGYMKDLDAMQGMLYQGAGGGGVGGGADKRRRQQDEIAKKKLDEKEKAEKNDDGAVPKPRGRGRGRN